MKREILIIALAIFLTSFISATVINVNGACVNTIPGDDPLCDDAVTYLTIQGAINVAANGDVINVATGTYDEQVVIDGKILTLQGAGDTTIVRPSSPAVLTSLYTYPAGTFWPGTVMASTILVKNTGGIGVTIKNLKVDGVNVASLPVGAGRLTGILYGESSGLIDGVIATTIKVTDYSLRSYGIDLSAVSGSHNVEVKNSLVNDWSRNGVQVQGASITSNIHNNTLVGPGSASLLQSAAVPNGILFIQNAEGNATNNTIHALHHDLTPSRSAGILLYGTTGVRIENNNIYDTDDGIILSKIATSAIVRGNNLHDNLETGIHLEDGATSNAITGNTIVNNAMAGIRFGGAGDPIPANADTPPGAGNSAHQNVIAGNVAGVVNYDTGLGQIFNATQNWWGDCTGPTHSSNPLGTGDSVSDNVLFTPWIEICKVEVQCASELNNVTLSADIDNILNISNVWFSYTLNGTTYNKTATNIGTNYSITINASGLVGGQNINWTVYANDTSGFVFKDGTPTFYVRNATFLGIAPWPWDGRNSSGSGYGWWVTEPTFTLTQDAQTNDSVNNSWYQWDESAIFKYTGSFDLDNIPNLNPITAGTLELKWWTTFGAVCGNETIQSQILFIDLTYPEIKDEQPTNGSTVFNNPRPVVSALLDEIYGSNSGINMSNVSMTLNGPLGNSSLIPGNLNVTNVTPLPAIKAFANFTPSVDLANGNYQVQVNATDNAGRFSTKTWNFIVNQTAPPVMTIHSPKNITYGTRKIPFNISITSEVEKLEYINYNDKNPRWKILCRDCNQSGFDKQKNKTLLEGENKIGIKATDFLNQINEQNVSLFIDSKAPKIHKTTPAKNKVTNGSFSIEYTEDNVKEVLLSWNPTVNLTSQCNAPGKKVVCNVQINNNLSNFSAYDGQEIEYQVNMTDIANKTASTKPIKVLVDTIEPVINFFNHSISGKSVEFTIHVTETNFDEINYIDLSENNPKEKLLCSSLKDGVCNKKKTFKNGQHNLTINVLDEAGNLAQTNLNFTIV